jgi:hypothetical protein
MNKVQITFFPFGSEDMQEYELIKLLNREDENCQ